ncbi:MAG: DUF1127 domain-containing protein [Proteobacteria bacterium]|nr:DUF1127 domain-containing protein [Pseudomonadota bacterium]
MLIAMNPTLIALPLGNIALRCLQTLVRASSEAVTIWRHRALSRRHLAALADWQLTDIGRSPADALAEAAKPFWQA